MQAPVAVRVLLVRLLYCFTLPLPLHDSSSNTTDWRTLTGGCRLTVTQWQQLVRQVHRACPVVGGWRTETDVDVERDLVGRQAPSPRRSLHLTQHCHRCRGWTWKGRHCRKWSGSPRYASVSPSAYCSLRCRWRQPDGTATNSRQHSVSRAATD